MTEYKSCCNRVCLLAECSTRSSGGCICVCSLKDAESFYTKALEGDCKISNGAFIYTPGKKEIVSEEEKIHLESQLTQIRHKIKTYEK